MTAALESQHVDRTTPIPLYYQIAQVLRARIREGLLEPGAAIPTEEELQGMFQVSRATVRQAVRELCDEGLLRRERPRGTFVSSPRLEERLPELVSFSSEARQRGLVPAARVLHVSMGQAPARIADLLGIHERASTLRLDRLRLANDEPVAVMYSYLAGWCGLTPDLDYSGSVHLLLAQRGITVVDADQLIDAAEATAEHARLLRCRRGGPLLRVERLTMSADGRAVEHVIAVYRADRYAYRTRLSAAGPGIGLIQEPGNQGMHR